MCIALCTIVAHNTAQNRPDNFSPYPPDNHHCSDDVYLREGGRWHQTTAHWPVKVKQRNTPLLPVTSPDPDRLSKLFHRATQQRICNKIPSPKSPPHLKRVATLPREMPSTVTTQWSTTWFFCMTLYVQKFVLQDK